MFITGVNKEIPAMTIHRPAWSFSIKTIRSGIAAQIPTNHHIMARHKSYESAVDAGPALDISSLIDVCFLLLIYFIVTSTITPRESDLGMSLPKRGKLEQTNEIAPLFIKIDATGAIFTGLKAGQLAMDTDSSSRNLPLLESHLKMYADAAKASISTPLVQILVDTEASHQRVIDVLNALVSVDISSVTFTDLVE